MANRRNSDSDGSLDDARIEKYKEKVGPMFNNMNTLQKRDFEADRIENVEVPKEFVKLAKQDVRTYEERLRKRLQPMPMEWRSEAEPLTRPPYPQGKFSAQKLNDIPVNIIKNTRLVVQELKDQMQAIVAQSNEGSDAPAQPFKFEADNGADMEDLNAMKRALEAFIKAI